MVPLCLELPAVAQASKKNSNTGFRATPDLQERFDAALATRGKTPKSVAMRELVEAFVRYVEEHGHQPNFPITIGP